MPGGGYLSRLESDADFLPQNLRRAAPPLPPRAPSNVLDVPLPPQLQPPINNSPYSHQSHSFDDPRTASNQSLGQERSPQDGRRELLLIYIHGFMGNETSFRSFPAHVHNILTVTLADTHTVRSKIYPRYKSRGKINAAAEDFSKWLTPHESANTDVFLLGHSMGGLLSAEVTLLTPHQPAAGGPLRHRIVGTINFDVPFLGLHPGVISSGLSSIFRSKDRSASHPDIQQAEADVYSSLTSPSESTLASESSTSSAGRPGRQSTMFQQPDDPNFNPEYANDVKLVKRKGLDNFLHFVQKHSGALRTATKQYVKSHAVFGGVMADYSALGDRYAKIRALEDKDAEVRKRALHSALPPPRARFVNYYTACTGVPKRLKSKSPTASTKDLTAVTSSEVEGNMAKLNIHPDLSTLDSETTPPQLSDSSSSEPPKEDQKPIATPETSTNPAHLPPIPPEPVKPSPLDISALLDEGSREFAQKDHDRRMGEYTRAMEERNKVIRERSGSADQTEGTITSTQSSGQPKESSSSEKPHNVDFETQNTQQSNVPPTDGSTNLLSATSSGSRKELSRPTSPASLQEVTSTTSSKKPKKKKDRKFCMLPSKDAKGERDSTWVRVFMPNVDEVGAHCGIFVDDGESYEQLVGDTAWRVEDWLEIR